MVQPLQPCVRADLHQTPDSWLAGGEVDEEPEGVQVLQRRTTVLGAQRAKVKLAAHPPTRIHLLENVLEVLQFVA